MRTKDKIEDLENRLRIAETEIKWLEERIYKVDMDFARRVEFCIRDKVHYQVVERLEDYEKGMKLEPVIKQVKDILK